MKKLIALLLAVVMVMGLAACGSKTTTETKAPTEAKVDTPATEAKTDAPAAAGSVYYLNFKPEFDQALQGLAASYTEKTGVPVKVVTAASGDYSNTLNAQMGKDGAPTIYNIGNMSGLKDWDEYALDLTGTALAGELATNDFNLYNEAGELKAMGYCYESFGIIVNTKLLADAGHSLDEIKDFASLKAVADDIHARAAELGFDAFSSAGLDGSSSWRFSGHLANMPLYYEFRDDGVTEQPADCDPAVKAITITITAEDLAQFYEILFTMVRSNEELMSVLSTYGNATLNGESMTVEEMMDQLPAQIRERKDQIPDIPLVIYLDADNGLVKMTESMTMAVDDSEPVTAEFVVNRNTAEIGVTYDATLTAVQGTDNNVMVKVSVLTDSKTTDDVSMAVYALGSEQEDAEMFRLSYAAQKNYAADKAERHSTVTLRFRVGGVMKKRVVKLYLGDEAVVSRKRPVMAPGEMEELKLTKDMLDAHPGLTRIHITVEEA